MVSSKVGGQLLMTAVEEGTRMNEHTFKPAVKTYGSGFYDTPLKPGAVYTKRLWRLAQESGEKSLDCIRAAARA